MKLLLFAAALTVATAPLPAADIGLSLSIGQPDFYGRLDIGDFPQPRLISRQPIVIERGGFDRPPIYLRVPRYHAKHWRRYCHEYRACGERVFFVDENWYRREYVPHYQKHHRDHRDDRRDDRHEHRDEHRGSQDNRRGDGHNRDNHAYVSRPQEHHRDRRDDRQDKRQDDHPGNQDNRQDNRHGNGKKP